MSWVAVGIGVGGSVLGGIVGKQKAPKAAVFKPVDVQAEQDKAITGNTNAESGIEQLLARANSFTQDQATGLMEKAVPGYSKIAGRFMDQANGLLTDPYSLPTDVTSNLSRLASERGVATGIHGQAKDFSLLRDFGINSLRYGQSRISQAQSILQSIASLSPRVSPMSPVSFYITPQQQVQTAGQNNSQQFNSEQSQNNANAGASNANASMWGNIIGNSAGLVAGGVGGAAKKPKVAAPADNGLSYV